MPLLARNSIALTIRRLQARTPATIHRARISCADRGGA
jgi:hypothetical protein